MRLGLTSKLGFEVESGDLSFSEGGKTKKIKYEEK